MRIYRVDFYDVNLGACVSWQGNRRAAQAELRSLQRERGEPASGPEGISAVEIPTSKAGLLAWLNRNFTSDNG